MKNKKFIVFFIIGVLIIGGLGWLALTNPAPSQGVIQDKRYTDAELDTDCKGTGVKRKCTTHWDPAMCEFLLVDGTNTGWIEIHCDTYKKMSVGQYYRG